MNQMLMGVIAGGAGVVGAQALFFLVRRIVRGASAASVADAFRAEAERRARDAEDRLRLAELEIARNGGASVEPTKKVTVRPVR